MIYELMGLHLPKLCVVWTELENGLHQRPPQFSWRSANEVFSVFERKI